jgi:hypothetical protein
LVCIETPAALRHFRLIILIQIGVERNERVIRNRAEIDDKFRAATTPDDIPVNDIVEDELRTPERVKRQRSIGNNDTVPEKVYRREERAAPERARRMVQFATTFSDEPIVVTLSRQLSWSHFVSLLPPKDSLQREYYAQMC